MIRSVRACARALAVLAVVFLALTAAPRADTAPQTLTFGQDWTNTALISSDNNWSGVPGIIGYRGDGMVGSTGVDPQAVLADGSATPVSVLANQTNPNTLTTGGVAEFHLANPVVALQGSGTARAPHIVISVSTAGLSTIQVSYTLRDVDGSGDNAVQPVALQYRAGSSGPYTNVPAGFVADATSGPSLATLVTPVNVTLPAAAENQPLVQIRIITTDAAGSDEWVGIDDINVTGSQRPQPTNPTGIGSATPSSVTAGNTTLLTVAVTPGQNETSTGLSVTGDLSSIAGSATQPFFDDGTRGDATAGDNIFSYRATVEASTPEGAKSLPVTVSDAQGRSSNPKIDLVVVAPAPPIKISQVYGGGGNSGATLTNDFIELHNPNAFAVSLVGWSVQYAAQTGTSWTPTLLTGSIPAGGFYLIQEAAGAGGTQPLPAPDDAGTIAMSGSSGKVALVHATGALSGSCPPSASIVDLVGYGTANCFEGSGAAPTLTNTLAAIRLANGDQDTDDNKADFVAGAPMPRNIHGLAPSGTGQAVPGSLDSGDISLLNVTVTPGRFPDSTNLSVTADLSAIGGAATQPFFDDGTHGDVTAGDRVFSLASAVIGPVGSKNIVATVSDAQARSTTTTFAVAIAPPPVPIHDIQGAFSQSPFAGQLMKTIGIVTAVRASSFYIEAPVADWDADPQTSEGLLVFTGSAPPVSRGALVRVTGIVQEFRPSADPSSPPITELSGQLSITVLSAGNPLPPPVVLLSSDVSPSGDFEQLERYEGMRVTVDVTATSGTQAFRRTTVDEQNNRSTSNGEFFAVIGDTPRPRREPGLEPTQPAPAGSPCCVPRFDGDPERIRVDSDGQAGASKIEIVAGQKIAGLTGVLDYGFRAYTVVPDPGTWTPTGNAAAVPVPAANASEFTVASFNMERFYDDVADGYAEEVVLTTGAFNARLRKTSLAIRDVLRMPDVIGVEEVENINALTRVANQVNTDEIDAGRPDPQYQAYLVEGNDVGGIDVGFLVKGSRVDVVAVTQIGKDTIFAFDGSKLNDRPSLVLEARVHRDIGSPYPVTVIVNHLRSLSGIDGSEGARIRAKRQTQAEFLASYLQARQTAHPAERIISVGDYNAFQFNDGYVDVMGTIEGIPTPADQAVLASADLVNPDFVPLDDTLGADQYSFLFDGIAQTLDHILVNAPAADRFSRIAYARNDADFPESFRNDATRPERLSDHDMPVAYFSFPGAPTLTLNGAATMTVECCSTFVDPGATAFDPGLGAAIPVSVTGTVNTTVPGTYTVTYSADEGYLTTARTVKVVDTTPPLLALNGAANVTLEAGQAWTDPGASAIDACAGDLTGVITIGGSVQTAVPGVYTLVYSVSDGTNSSTVKRTVTVVDTTAPSIGGVAASPNVITPPNHKMWDVTVSYAATDVTGVPVCSLAVSSNEALNGPGDGNTAVDWQVIDANHVRLRAERAGTGTGRLYTLTISCRDAAGNRGTATATVSVPH